MSKALRRKISKYSSFTRNQNIRPHLYLVYATSSRQELLVLLTGRTTPTNRKAVHPQVEDGIPVK